MGTATVEGGPFFMKIQLDHIGIATTDPDKLRQLFGILGLAANHSEVVPSEKVKTTFIPVSSTESSIELLEPTEKDSVIAKFLEKKGPGIHHLSFRFSIGSLDTITKNLRAAGYRLVYNEARMGAHQMRVNFIHPADAGGVLVEIMEPQKE